MLKIHEFDFPQAEKTPKSMNSNDCLITPLVNFGSGEAGKIFLYTFYTENETLI